MIRRRYNLGNRDWYPHKQQQQFVFFRNYTGRHWHTSGVPLAFRRGCIFVPVGDGAVIFFLYNQLRYTGRRWHTSRVTTSFPSEANMV